MTNQPDHSQPDPASPPPSAPDGTSAADGTAPISGQPWSHPSGDALSSTPQPYRPPSPAAYAPGYAAIPEPEPELDYPPTSQFPPVNYAPPGYTPDYGQGGYPPAGYAANAPGAAPGYAPASAPGYPPGYPPGSAAGYAPASAPGYPPGYAPPPPPPRKSNAPLIAVILAVTLLLCGGVATAGVLVARSVADKAKEAAAPITDLPTDEPQLPGLPTNLPTDSNGHTVSVTYEVSGDGPVTIVYFDKVGAAPVRLTDVKLPWKVTTEVSTPALLEVVAVRAGTDQGTVDCRALVDGDEVASNSSDESNFAMVSCTHLAID
ncbi:MmpS family transport accessory protein [Paractinoplanes globisporus]|uniref:MmpS family transport accessory protein n=1 Tax=Paractinoplanes globisporus TaxID=113565 RepID=A0ABW6WGV8_9ACTN|nr:MmpS family transport accessory protein [Actinoplanes globisporus]